MLVFKVVRRNKSALMQGELAVRYVIGRTTKPKHRLFPLYAFTHISYAKACIAYFGADLRILKCEATRSRNRNIKAIAILTCEYYSKATILQWADPSTYSAILRAHEGTVMCSSITPLHYIV